MKMVAAILVAVFVRVPLGQLPVAMADELMAQGGQGDHQDCRWICTNELLQLLLWNCTQLGHVAEPLLAHVFNICS